MSGFWSGLLVSLCALLMLAIAVAWMEHIARQAERRRLRDQAAPAGPASLRALANVDVHLDALVAPGDDPAPTDRDARRAALEKALVRMAEPPETRGDSAWADTLPRVNLGKTEAAADSPPLPGNAA